MRLIDADALERQGWTMQRIVPVNSQTMEYQMKKPTDFPTIDAVQVVRCKDCKYWHNYDDVPVIGSCGYYDDIWNKRKDDFCSMGERKDDEQGRNS